ncbi:hypothetical protein VKT23_008613 [Stygiomarasmius scandens]|uniref:LysM domain-containing protein n=1 Tax=Marasmiellus scandens TaxID=2682957 RepID=A0ABR1JI14_9AGAR
MFSFTSVVVLSAVLAGVTAQIPPTCTRTYTVVPGDICDHISAKAHSSTFQLANANQGVINDFCGNLSVGQEICLGLAGSDCTTTTVVSADRPICLEVAQDAGIPLETLLHNNPNIDSFCGNIYPGEVLCTSDQLFNYN